MHLRNFTVVLAIIAGSLQAQVCDLTFTSCPDKLPPGPITVPFDIISLDVKIPACPVIGGPSPAPSPSIMFVIDHSGSMTSTDPTHSRFTVVSNLLDSIYAASPTAHVGMAIFYSRLAFDYRDNSLFQSLFPGDSTQHDSFVPLMQLDSTFADGSKRVLDTLKALLKIDEQGNLIYNTKRPKERAPFAGSTTSNRRTDITLGFEAALAAMRSSSSAKADQYIIFLSDGEPNVQDEIRIPSMNTFVAGINTPTTFTVYFNPNSNTPPSIITTMTNNIKANAYSTSNPNSAMFNITTPGAELQTILRQNILSQILLSSFNKGVTVTVMGGPALSTTTKLDNSYFLLSSRINLNSGSTSMTFSYAQSYRDTNFAPALIKDTTIMYSLTVNRSAAGTVGGYVSKSCREQPTLGLYSPSTELTHINDNQTNLEIRLVPPKGMPCVNCTVLATSSKSLDMEVITLTNSGPYLSGPLIRVESLNPITGDGKLQHLASENIVLTWVSPENQLNMVRKIYPYQLQSSIHAPFVNGKETESFKAYKNTVEDKLNRALHSVCPSCTHWRLSANGRLQ